MAETDLGRQVARPRAYFVVERIHDPDEARSLLRPRIEYTAYALAQLEPGLVEHARIYQAQGETGAGIVVHSSGGLGEAILASGDPAAIGAILHLYPGAAQTYATFQPQHSDVFRRSYSLATSQTMVRMAVKADAFQPTEGRTIGLTGSDIRRINALYSSEGRPTYYTPEHIDSGVYRGVISQGRLVAIAGTHVVSRQERVAVVGNVFTHPDFRMKGFARIATGAVTEKLFDFCDDVVLTVDPNNKPAIRAYTRLGYHESCQLIESTARRRDLTGVKSAVRRVVAGLRGRRYPGPLVSYRE